MSVRSKRWCFTINNYTDASLVALDALECVYLVYGRETAPGTGTPHLQGFVIFANARRRSSLALLCPGHWEPTTGPSVAAAVYCKKDGDFTERGTAPVGQGKRTDLQAIMDWLDEFIADNGRAPTEREVALQQPIALLKRLDIMRVARLRAPPPKLREGELREWQQFLETELENEADDRSVSFFVDPTGGKGKTWFQQFLLTKRPDDVQVLGVGKRDDMCYAIDASKSVFLINVPRGGMEFLQYTVLEQLKDRMVFSTKYQSVLKTLSKAPHVVVFCNEDPDMTKMSADRYVIHAMP